jgi:rare lipoprotein A
MLFLPDLLPLQYCPSDSKKANRNSGQRFDSCFGFRLGEIEFDNQDLSKLLFTWLPGAVLMNIRALPLLALVLLILCGCAKSVAPTKPPSPSPSQPAPVSIPGPAQKAPATQRPYSVFGQTYQPIPSAHGYAEEGVASWYGADFHGRKTACGERYDMHALTAAHRILPMHTQVRVINIENGRSVVLRINDRGPFAKERIIDLSYAAAKELDVVRKGTARVRVESLNVVPDDIPGVYFVQAGSFIDPGNAHRLKSRLVASGFSGTRILEEKVDGVRFWRVQAGVFRGLVAAQDALSRLVRENPASFILAD